MNFRRGRDEEPEINLVPLIDVLLVIIIFLMLSTTFTRFAELRITLPGAQGQSTEQRPREIQVAVSADGRYAIDRVPVPFRDVSVLAQALQQAAADRKDPVLIINADAAASHQSVVNVMEAARMAGIARLAFATQREAAPASQ
ncbi:MAG TPA: biopolymer transporter ExbD [Burkholderiaceae bacterium]|nr:biopolymer transporter ExbD [Burkholderiaceae bacterium]